MQQQTQGRVGWVLAIEPVDRAEWEVAVDAAEPIWYETQGGHPGELDQIEGARQALKDLAKHTGQGWPKISGAAFGHLMQVDEQIPGVLTHLDIFRVQITAVP